MSKNHIKDVYNETMGICGETLTHEFHFKSIEQAYLNGMYDTKVLTCKKCTDIVCAVLNTGSYEGITT